MDNMIEVKGVFGQFRAMIKEAGGIWVESTNGGSDKWMAPAEEAKRIQALIDEHKAANPYTPRVRNIIKMAGKEFRWECKGTSKKVDILVFSGDEIVLDVKEYEPAWCENPALRFTIGMEDKEKPYIKRLLSALPIAQSEVVVSSANPDDEKMMTFEDNQFVWVGGFSTKDLPKAAGFRWNPTLKGWFTSDKNVAAKLADHAKASAREALNQ